MDQEYLHQQIERGMVLSNQGKYMEADALFRNLYQEAENLDQKFLMADLLYHRGWNYYISDRYHRARKIFDKLARLAKPFYPKGMANALNGHGLVNLALGQLERALECFERCLSLKKMLALPLGTPFTNIGIVFREMGKYSDALQYLRLAKSIFEQEGTLIAQTNAVTVIQHMAGIYRDRGEWERAQELTQQHVKLREQISPNMLGMALLDLAQCFKSRGQRDRAYNTIERAIKHNEKLDLEKVEPLLFLADLYIEDERIEEAGLVLEKAEKMALKHTSEHEEILCNIVRGKYIERASSDLTHAADSIKQAYALYHNALRKAEELGFLKEVLSANLELARLDISRENFEGAEAFLKAVQTPANRYNLIPIQIKALILRSLLLSARFRLPEALKILETSKNVAKETKMHSPIMTIKKVVDHISKAAQSAEKYKSVLDFENSSEGREHQETAQKHLQSYILTLKETL